MYRIIYEKRICKDLDKIPVIDVEKIRNLFKNLSRSPTPSGSKKLSTKVGLYRMRQGDYRIIYTIDHREKEVRIILVSHRKEAYRQL